MLTETTYDRVLDRLSELRGPNGIWASTCIVLEHDPDQVSALAGVALAEFALSELGTQQQRDRAAELAHETALKLCVRQAMAGNPTGPLGDEPHLMVTFLVARLVDMLERLPSVSAVPADTVDGLGKAVVRHPGLKNFLNLQLNRELLGQPTEMDAIRVLSLYHIGKLSKEALGAIWRERFVAEQSWDGTWDSSIGQDYGLATSIVLEVWETAGRPAPAPRPVRVSTEATLYQHLNIAMARLRIEGEAAKPAAEEVLRSMAADAQRGRVGPLTCAAALKLGVVLSDRGQLGEPHLRLVG
ncbi:MAG: hypothetical protein AAGA78_09465 [Pseudomonadota bacterium]